VRFEEKRVGKLGRVRAKRIDVCWGKNHPRNEDSTTFERKSHRGKRRGASGEKRNSWKLGRSEEVKTRRKQEEDSVITPSEEGEDIKEFEEKKGARGVYRLIKGEEKIWSQYQCRFLHIRGSLGRDEGTWQRVLRHAVARG